MVLPIFTAGEILAAADVNTWFMPKVIIKPNTTGRASNTTISDDPDLTMALASNTTYQVSGFIIYDGAVASSADIKWTFSIPSGSSGQYFVAHQNLSGAFTGAFTSNWTDSPLTANTNGVGSSMTLLIQGILVTSSTAGSMTFRWAQNTSSATNTHVQAQSYLVFNAIA